MVRRLVEDNPSPTCSIQFFRPPRAIEKIREIHRRDHAQLAEAALRNQLARAANGQVETVAVPDDHLHACPGRDVDHGATFVERQRHGLFDQHMLAMTGSERGVTGMKLVRSRDIDCLDFIIRTQLFNTAISAGRKIGCKTRPCFRAWIGRGQQSDLGILHKAWSHEPESAAQSRYAQSQRAISRHGLTRSGASRGQSTGLVPHAHVSGFTANADRADDYADPGDRHRIEQAHQRNPGECPGKQRGDERHAAAKHAISDMIRQATLSCSGFGPGKVRPGTPQSGRKPWSRE